MKAEDMTTLAWEEWRQIMRRPDWDAWVRKNCRGCLYYTTVAEVTGQCEYIVMVGHSRQCAPTECRSLGIYQKATRREKLAAKKKSVKDNYSPAPSPKEPKKEKRVLLTEEEKKAHKAAYMQKWQASRKGVCTRCGGVVSEDRKTCEACLEKLRIKYRAAKEAKRAPEPETGLAQVREPAVPEKKKARGGGGRKQPLPPLTEKAEGSRTMPPVRPAPGSTGAPALRGMP